jgi:AraC family transcriptional regulator
MNPLKQFNLAMHYIETHLADEIDFQAVARLACCSEYHFRRMFASLASLNLSEYIRRRRLSQAAFELQHSSARVIDLAVKYGYGSADAFARAFQALHGVTPSEARLNGTQMKVVSPMTFQLTVHGGTTMEYKIVEKGPFFIVGVHKQVKLIYRGVNPEIAAMAKALYEDEASMETLLQLGDVEPRGLLNISTNFTEDRAEGSVLDHYVGVAATQRPSSEKWQTLAVAAATWAVFTSRGKFPDALQETWARIYTEWLVTSGYELTHGPEMLWVSDDDTNDPNYHSEIWITVQKASAPAV